MTSAAESLLLVEFGQARNDTIKQFELTSETLLGIIMVHEFEHISQLLEQLEFLPIKTKIWAHLPKADRTKSKWLLIRLFKLAGAVHEAFVCLAMADGEDMRQLVAGGFHSTILYLTCYFRCKLAHSSLPKVWMMPCIALDAYPPALLGHSENKSPALLWVQIGIRQHQEALILFQPNILLQVIEKLASMKLPHSCIRTDSWLYDLLLVKFP